MKKIAFIVALIMLTAVTCACSILDDPIKTPIGTGTKDNSDNISSSDETTASQSNNTVDIDEQVLFDKDNVKITAKKWVTDDIFGDGIKLYIENNTDKNLGISVEYLIVNGYIITDFFSAEVAAGKKSNETLNFSNAALEKCGITKIGQIEVIMSAFDSETYDTVIEFGKAEIKTNLYDSMDGGNSDGTTLLEKNGIKIVGKYIEEDSLLGKEVVLYIESEIDVTISVENLTVNDYTITDFTSITILSGYKTVDSITLLQSELDENDITSIEKVEFNIRAYNPNTYDDYFTSETIVCTPEIK